MLLTAATAYADWLTTELRQTAQAERAAVAEPIAFPTIRHQCPHCSRTWAKRTAAAAHIARCWHNPDARGCKTCIHYEPPSEGPYPEHPGWPEDCGAGRTDPGIHIDCPLWSLHSIGT